jgi:DUF1707 SHOCT-like domain
MQAGGEDIRETGAWRISDADRDQISSVLSEHAAEGRLTMDELDQRLGTLYAAQTRAQAAAVVADLPPLTAPDEPHHFHIGHDDEPVPALPEWLASWRLVELDTAPARPAPGGAPAPPRTPHQDRAAARKRAKLRQDENAIGHTFQATRRAINAQIESASASGGSGDVERLRERLREAQDTAASAHRAVAAGDRAEVQRRLVRLRTLGTLS